MVVQEPTDQFWGHRDWGISDPDGYLIFISKVTRLLRRRDARGCAGRIPRLLTAP